ncbi:MAG TPA: nucleotide exchange factor GrpE, partial [Candidatus Limnocylindrales bacterium]|nr:nucleotide exchange factor GrpE [Candidatus Limnocylindrales bacterium]
MSEEFKKDADESGADESNEAPPQEIDSNSEAELLFLRQQLETKETEAKNYYERLLRQAAELENYKKRSARERDDAIRYANESLLKDLLPVVDNLER